MKKEQERKREREEEREREREIPAEVARTEEAREGGVLLEEVGSCLLSRVVSHLIFA